MSIIYINGTFIKDWRSIKARAAQITVERELGRAEVFTFLGRVQPADASVERVLGHLMHVAPTLMDVEYTFGVCLVQSMADGLERRCLALGLEGVKVGAATLDRGAWAQAGRRVEHVGVNLTIEHTAQRPGERHVCAVTIDPAGRYLASKTVLIEGGDGEPPTPGAFDQDSGELWGDARHALESPDLLGDWTARAVDLLKALCMEGLDS